MTQSPVLDYTTAALQRLQREALEKGNKVEARALTLLIEGYEEGLWHITWRGGQPLFTAAIGGQAEGPC